MRVSLCKSYYHFGIFSIIVSITFLILGFFFGYNFLRLIITLFFLILGIFCLFFYNLFGEPGKTQHRNIFNTWWLAKIYDLYVWISVLGRVSQLRNAVLSYIPKNSKTIIDLATGTGSVANIIQKKYPDAKVIGVDLSKYMLEVARKKNNKIEWIVNDASTFKKKADFIVISFALHDLPIESRQQLIKQSYENLRKGGVFLIYDYHNPKNLIAKIPMIIQYYLAEEEQSKDFLTQDLVSELKNAGFISVNQKINHAGLSQLVSGTRL